MDTKQLSVIGSATVFGIGVIAICVGIDMFKKSKKAIEKSKKAIDNMNEAIDSLADKTPVEVSEDIIKAAAERAADKAAERAVETVRKDINTKVYHTTKSAYDDVKDEIRDKMSKKIEDVIDMDDLARSVENRATSKIVGKFMANATEYVGPIMSCIVNGDYRKEKANEVRC